ncbi:MAG: hypothetical protein C4519_02550 [Desulfobacteraceae bacterium]|nr:MAG: hypothetical protein C4519_02550 [Desulfobacteraceae bacterium]
MRALSMTKGARSKMRIAILVSGGVDSSVALRLLQGQGFNLTAFYLKIQPVDTALLPGGNCWQEDLAYARAVCRMLNVPLEVISLNNARSVKENGTVLLKTSPDPVKDQTYFLSLLDQRQLSKTIFPLGKMKKAEVRELAEDFNFPTKTRKDSQGICLLGNIKFGDLVLHYLGKRSGDILERRNLKKLGEHRGTGFSPLKELKPGSYFWNEATRGSPPASMRLFTRKLGFGSSAAATAALLAALLHFDDSRTFQVSSWELEEMIQIARRNGI